MSATDQVKSVEPTRPSRLGCWLTCLLISLGFQAVGMVVEKLGVAFFPGSFHSTAVERYCRAVTQVWISEVVALGLVWCFLRRRGDTFRNLGLWRWGTPSAWLVALGFALLSILQGIANMRRLGYPVSALVDPSGYHIYAALALGLSAGICEEIVFRGFMMSEFARVGYGKVVQVVAPGLFFGLSHFRFLDQGFWLGLGVMAPTAFLGMMWGVAYLLGKKSLLPCIVAHFLNDSTALPWILFGVMSQHAS